MEAGHSEALTLPATPEPFALIVGAAMRGKAAQSVETAIRHMGLRPERLSDRSPADARLASPAFRLHFGSMSILAGSAAGDAMDLADPVHPSTSLLAASLPADWRDGGKCWIFIPESAAGEGGVDTSPAHMREFFRMMVLLIDLFDASRIFWSPARLWSDAPQFRDATAEMVASGMPPVLHLIAFRRRETDDGAVVRTRGLAIFGGQELEGRIPPGWTVAEMIKRMARLALDIMINGPVSGPQRVRGIEPGEWVALAPAGGGDGRQTTTLVEFSHRG